MATVTALLDALRLADKPYYTFEFFPPKTPDGLTNLHARLERMARLGPSAVHLTWGPNGSTAHASIQLANLVQAQLNIPACLHLTCTNASIEVLDRALEQAKKLGIVNILALRGDPPRGTEYDPSATNVFNHAVDLVKYIHQKFPDTFCLGVAGYPEGSKDFTPDQELQFLKDKVDAGAHFIVSQVFYDVDLFLNWYQECRRIGIKVPIIPGIMPIQSFDSFRRLTSLCNLSIPTTITDSLTPIKANDEAVKSFGLNLSIEMIQTLLKNNVKAFHICTLNLERTVTRLVNLLEWAPTIDTQKIVKKVASPGLPVTWDEFPNGRFGDSRSPAFGNPLTTTTSTIKSNSKDWGNNPVTENDITNLFLGYTKGIYKSTPWSLNEPLLNESDGILEYLVTLNQSGIIWSISSQPVVNGIKSNDKIFGFGPPNGGYIYQKSFIEFFVSKHHLEKIVKFLELENLGMKDGVGMFKFLAGKKNDEDQVWSNLGKGETNAVTWGVFRGAEVVTSTMIELSSFKTWKNEAFEIWEEWARVFEIGSPSRKLLMDMSNEKWLCTIVHHDYVNQPNALWDFLVKMVHDDST